MTILRSADTQKYIFWQETDSLSFSVCVVYNPDIFQHVGKVFTVVLVLDIECISNDIIITYAFQISLECS